MPWLNTGFRIGFAAILFVAVAQVLHKSAVHNISGAGDMIKMRNFSQYLKLRAKVSRVPSPPW